MERTKCESMLPLECLRIAFKAYLPALHSRGRDASQPCGRYMILRPSRAETVPCLPVTGTSPATVDNQRLSCAIFPVFFSGQQTTRVVANSYQPRRTKEQLPKLQVYSQELDLIIACPCYFRSSPSAAPGGSRNLTGFSAHYRRCLSRNQKHQTTLDHQGRMGTSCVIPHSCFSRLEGLINAVKYVVDIVSYLGSCGWVTAPFRTWGRSSVRPMGHLLDVVQSMMSS